MPDSMTDNTLERWIGNREQSTDHLDSALVARVAATFGKPCPAPGEPLPPLWHWAFFQNPLPGDQLGGDGHPTRGGFLPPADDRNRMWAGGRLEFLTPLKAGIEAERVSTVTDIQEKHGRTGSLLFVTVQHDYRQAGELAIREEQDIVYRQPAPPKLSLDEPMPDADWSQTIEPDPVLLFRYSAVTFNGHRIHYDWPYVTETEGYPGLVVHGPLIATLQLQAFCEANPQARPKRMQYRGLRPLIANKPFQTTGRITGVGRAELTAGNEDGPAHRATVEFNNTEDQESRS
ncbi:MaoC family dehydratase N-terminal domain-containing protein [Salinicola sp. LHM]|uniref:FAS1-like dehydratase domain-containing protein n=1 Tax=unclassified Salinicola TaxID=2634022 RepID=UPI000AFBE953|nr:MULTISPECIES: MaoC family dehydratase N-terminal domain-containing protein [unclassified Salinicola]WQH34534.1 MaoC family dehydratase N-terminal domain-containing protein [Salinicola sp. LHM]